MKVLNRTTTVVMNCLLYTFDTSVLRWLGVSRPIDSFGIMTIFFYTFKFLWGSIFSFFLYFFLFFHSFLSFRSRVDYTCSISKLMGPCVTSITVSHITEMCYLFYYSKKWYRIISRTVVMTVNIWTIQTGHFFVCSLQHFMQKLSISFSLYFSSFE